MDSEHTIEIDLLDAFTAVKLRDLAMIRLQSQAVAEALRVILLPSKNMTFLERRDATNQAKLTLAAFDAMPDLLTNNGDTI